MQTFQTSKVNTALAAKQIFSLISEEMKLVEVEFKNLATSNIQVINYLGDYLRKSGGKRVRPSLLLLSNFAAGGNAESDSVIRMATVMEMIHTATLVHDDIIDNADTRRNNPSVNARFGNQASVLMGDWLYMKAFEVSLEERSLEVLDILTALTRKMTEGELIQLTVIGRADIDRDTYFDILKRKTAYLFSACCEIGAILSGATEDVRQQLKEFGMNLGTAFQLADDVLDFTANADVLGKASGADLIEGKVTLPLILLMEENPESVDLVEQVMRDGAFQDGTKEQLLRQLNKHGCIERTRSKALNIAAEARKNLAVLPESKYRKALEEIPHLMINREK